ncbi:hypothetical protein PG990_008485 [Apiospora arundinis]
MMTAKYAAAVISLIRQAVADLDDNHDADLLTYALLISTCHHAGFPYHDLECVEVSKITDVLHQAMQERAGIGSAPGGKADISGTSVCIQALTYALKPVGIDDMLRQYEAQKGFLTYPDGEHYSFNANCRALAAIVCHDDASKYKLQILKTVGFLCQSWWDSDGKIHDQTTSTHLHCSLLFLQSMTQVLALMDRETPNQLMDPDLTSRLMVAVFQACLRTMLVQRDDGSWSSSAEESAYGVLILCEARRLTMFSTLASHLDLAIKRGVTYLEAFAVYPPTQPSKGHTSSPSTATQQLYVLVALYRAAAPPTGSIGDGSFDMARVAKGRKHVKLLSMTPLFSAIPEWEIQASMVESVLFQPMLYARRLDIFPRKDMEDDTKYFDIIPFTWTSCNNRQRAFASTSFLYEMMVISFLNYQADEFLESCAGSVPTDTLRQLIDGAFLPGSDVAHSHMPSYPDIVKTLHRFVTYISTHPCVLAASSWDRASVMRELRIFLHAHVTQLVDNVDFQKKQQTADSLNGCVTEHDASQETFFGWVRTTSANHTSCPYSFSFVSCLLSSSLMDGRECFPAVQEKYFASAACLHLATMCRMYNDYGSTGRDAAEGNLNSINFPEYDSTPGGTEGKKRALFDMADYERGCLRRALQSLGAVSRDTGDASLDQMQNRQMEIWQMFCDVTDLYGQIYVVRDIGSRITGPVSGPKA